MGGIDKMNISILGLGTVGMGAFEAANNTESLNVKKALIRNPKPGFEKITTTNYKEIINDPDIDIICECMGGLHPAYEYVMEALQKGKHIVTPNKELISTYYRELTHCADTNGVLLRYTAAAGGGIPWLFNLLRTKRCDEIIEISGIINGTSNYIIDRMTEEGAEFDEALQDAKQAGYAEADPSSDIDGYDTLHKCSISANLAFGKLFKESKIPVAGIRNITSSDIKMFEESGCACKLMMRAGKIDDKFFAFVEPTLIPKDRIEANVHKNNNLITLHGKNLGIQSFYGEGAGKMPTGTSVIQDALDIAAGGEVLRTGVLSEAVIDNDMVKRSYYFRSDKGSSVTEPMTVAAAHKLYQVALEKESSVFMASISE